MCVTLRNRRAAPPVPAAAHSSRSAIAAAIDAPQDGDYILHAQAYASTQAGKDPAKMQLNLDGKPIQTFDVLAPAEDAAAGEPACFFAGIKLTPISRGL